MMSMVDKMMSMVDEMMSMVDVILICSSFFFFITHVYE